MQIALAFILIIVFSFALSRLNDHTAIRDDGGIRTKYNSIFSYIYNLPNAKIVYENASFVKINVEDDRRSLKFTLNYHTFLNVKCKVRYFDDTPFKNGTKLKWSVTEKSSIKRCLKKIQNDIDALP